MATTRKKKKPSVTSETKRVATFQMSPPQIYGGATRVKFEASLDSKGKVTIQSEAYCPRGWEISMADLELLVDGLRKEG